MNIPVRLKKVLVLGIATVVVVFLNKLWINRQLEPSSGFSIQPLSKGFGLAESEVGYDFYKDKLKSYPDPAKFKQFNFSNSSDSISVEGNCSDMYYTVIIYKERIDYRKNPSSAKFNQAFECPESKHFSYPLKLSDISLEFGDYYLIIADQGERESWYNPR